MPTNVEATQAATEPWIGAGAVRLGVAPAPITDLLQRDPDQTALTDRIRAHLRWVRAARSNG